MHLLLWSSSSCGETLHLLHHSSSCCSMSCTAVHATYTDLHAGSIPESWLTTLPALSNLYLDDSGLTGETPPRFVLAQLGARPEAILMAADCSCRTAPACCPIRASRIMATQENL